MFFKELFNVAIAGVGLGLAIAATVISGGLGIPLTAAAGVAFALAVSDAGCAAANWYKAAHGEQGLRMGEIHYRTLFMRFWIKWDCRMIELSFGQEQHRQRLDWV